MECSHPAYWGGGGEEHQSRIRTLRSAAVARKGAVSSPGCRLFLSLGEHKHWALRTSQRAAILRPPVLWRPNSTFSIIAAGRASELLRGRMHVWPEFRVFGFKNSTWRQKLHVTQVSRVSGYVSYSDYGTPISPIYTDVFFFLFALLPMSFLFSELLRLWADLDFRSW